MAEMDIGEGIQSQQAGAGTAGAMDATEKMVPQSKVNELVGHHKHESYERGRNEALASMQASQAPSSMGGMQAGNQDDIRRMIAEEQHKQNNIAHANNIAMQFTQKLEAGKSKYADLDHVVSKLNLPSIPHIAQWANGLENTADVIYDLGKNPSKLANLEVLSRISPELAMQEMQKLSASIKQNDDAQNAPSANEPLDQVKPSTIGTDNGSLAVRDWRKKSYLRG